MRGVASGLEKCRRYKGTSELHLSSYFYITFQEDTLDVPLYFSTGSECNVSLRTSSTHLPLAIY